MQSKHTVSLFLFFLSPSAFILNSPALPHGRASVILLRMDGILIVDKPEGWTSHDVVARARRLLREKRIGHTGTLDTFATGVLVWLGGRATRLAQFLSGAEKEYEATIRLGHDTDTGDLTGSRREGADSMTEECGSVTRGERGAGL